VTNTLRIDQAVPAAGIRPSGGVTELVLASEAPEQMALIMPMIAYLSQHSGERWITWITPQPISRQLLEGFGVNTTCLRLIHCKDNQQALWVTWEALQAGNSHTVIATPGKLADKELMQLEIAAQQGHCQGLLLRLR
jgi:cell division inhibitor SulA